MKSFFILTLSISTLLATQYYAKVDPYEIRNISSNVSGEVLFIDEEMIGKKLADKPYIMIDSEIDEKDLEYTKSKIEYLSKSLEVNLKVLKNLEDSTARKRENYKRVASLKIKSQADKDREFHDLISSENMLYNTQKEIQNQKIQIVDLKLRRAQLEKNLEYKNLKADGFVLYELLVKPGQVVNPSTPIAKVADVSKAKLIIYLNTKDAQEADKKIVYLDGEKTSYKLSRVSNIADSKNLSQYMAQIIIEAPEIFSKLVKVELKDE